MAARRSIRRRLTLAIVLTALVPMLVALVMARAMVRQTAGRFFVPEVGTRLDQALGLYQELAHAVKASMRHAASAIAARRMLVTAVEASDVSRMNAELEAALAAHSQLVSVELADASGRTLARAERKTPLDPQRELRLEVAAPIETDEPEHRAQLVAVFATDRARFDELEHMSRFVDTYRQVEQRRGSDESSYLQAFALLLGITILAAAGVGVLLARSVSSRIAELARATERVGAGDLTIRVPERGHDEIADLARAFNRMVGEVESSRARIEYLQRISAWQEMARRLAHEIKNPLTPIQLAVQELHSRYQGTDSQYRKLVDSTLEIVEDEVRTLRRLVSEFSDFARLPRAELTREDLAAFLEEQCDRIRHVEDEAEQDQTTDPNQPARPSLDLRCRLGVSPAPVLMDRQMLRRVLVNLVRNAVEAARDAHRSTVTVDVRLARERDCLLLDIEDDGPGIDDVLREVVFDPYFTTKHTGTGLGLAIVKKAIVEHGGSIEARAGSLGGAAFRVRLPVAAAGALDGADLGRSTGEPHPSASMQSPGESV